MEWTEPPEPTASGEFRFNAAPSIGGIVGVVLKYEDVSEELVGHVNGAGLAGGGPDGEEPLGGRKVVMVKPVWCPPWRD